MADSNIVITSTSPQGKVLQKTLTDINPDATNAQLATFGTMLNALTDNQYGKTVKITKVHCDVESGGGDTRPVPTFEFFESNCTTPLTDNQLSVIKNANNTFGFKSNSDGMIYLPCLGQKVDMFWRDAENQNGVKGFFIHTGNYFEAGDTVDAVIKTEETENFKAGSVTLHITVTD